MGPPETDERVPELSFSRISRMTGSDWAGQGWTKGDRRWAGLPHVVTEIQDAVTRQVYQWTPADFGDGIFTLHHTHMDDGVTQVWRKGAEEQKRAKSWKGNAA